MKPYYECHVTFQGPDPGIQGWTFSRIDGDPDLGSGRKSYLTRHFRDSMLLSDVVNEVEFVAKLLADSGPEFKILRTKVEHVCYDNRRQ